MKSMTGYGKGEASNGKRTVVIELKSVNNRYLEVSTRIPKSFSFAEDMIKKCVQERVKRGFVEVMFSYSVTGVSDKEVSIDDALATEYVSVAKKLVKQYSLCDDFTVGALMKMPEVVNVTPVTDNVEEIKELMRLATASAAEALDTMRVVEGEGIKSDLRKIVDNISSALDEVKKRTPGVVADYRDKLAKRIAELCDAGIDETRLATEVAIFADKCDINEEISRLASHINQFIDTLELDDAQGRKLDFLSQEMNREINTMGSKANDLRLTGLVLSMKNELEKAKEQIRNVE